MSKKTQSEQSQTNPSFTEKTLKIKIKGLSPKQIGHYSISQGSYAKVYRAIHNPTGQVVAVKVLNKQKMSPSELEKIYIEIDMHKRLLHTNIVRIYEVIQNLDKIYIFMELCKNGELFAYINRNGRLSEKFASKIFKEILSALKYLKSQRLFHRDIKCENILFDENWNAKLVDFGLMTHEAPQSFSSTFCGSPSYLTPELAKKREYHSEMVDVWCLGVTLYAMIAGELPFDGDKAKETKKNIKEIKYEMKTFFSDEAEEIFKKIFVEEGQRACIQDIEQTAFVKNGTVINSNFINVDVDRITVDPLISEILKTEFKVNPEEVKESVTKLKLDHHFSLYYLTVHREILKGTKVKYDISSPDFQKTKKRSSTLQVLKTKASKKSRVSQSNFKTLETPEIKGKKEASVKTPDTKGKKESYEARGLKESTEAKGNKLSSESREKKESSESKGKKSSYRIRLSLPSVEVRNARYRKRDDSPESPKRILDLVSAYRLNL